MKKLEILIINKLGLHARASSKLVMLASQFVCDIMLTKGSMSANAKSLMSVMMMAVTNGTVIEISADGVDEDEALEQLATLINNKFGEAE